MIDQLPLEVVITIFSKATLKTLLQCRRVCKSWLEALFDPETLKTSIKLPKCLVLHVNPNGSSDSNSNSRFVYLYDHRTIPSSENALLTLASKVNDNLDLASTELVGHCNGLLCWCRREPSGDADIFRITIQISNPLTGECLTIPAGTDYVPRHMSRSWHSKFNWESKIGFGYAPKQKQYKLVHLVNKRNGTLEAKVLTLGSNTWKCLKCPYEEVCARFGVHANGAMYLITRRSKQLCSFDLEKDEFGMFPSPPNGDNVDGVFVIKDWLTVWSSGGKQIWIMREGCWVELKSRGFHYYWRVDGFLDFERPLIFYPKKKSLVLCRQEFRFGGLYVSECKHNDLSLPFARINSFVSLSCGNIDEAISGFVPTFLSIQHVLNGE